MTDESSRPQQPSVQHDAIVAAFMALLAEKRFEDIGFAEIARRAGVSLSELRMKHASKIEMLAAYMRDVDRTVLDGIDAGLRRRTAARTAVRRTDASPRRLVGRQGRGEIVATVGSTFNPGLTLAVNGLAARSMQWMLTAADISAAGPEGHGTRAGPYLAVRIGAAHLAMTTTPDRRARSRRSIARCRAVSAGRACSTISAGFRRRLAARAARSADAR